MSAEPRDRSDADADGARRRVRAATAARAAAWRLDDAESCSAPIA